MVKAAAEMQQGKNKILLFRRLADAETQEATKLVFQTDHTFSFNRSLDKIMTKDGTLIKVGELESEVSIEAIQAKNDPVGNMLRDAVLKGEKLELWEVDIDPDAAGDEYNAIYAQGYLESWESGANVEDESAISSTFQVEMEPQFGTVTLTDEQETAVQYAFRDTAVVVPGV